MPRRKKSSANKITNAIVEHLPEADKEKDWAFNAIGHAGPELVKLQSGHWKLYLQELQKEFGDGLFANQCEIIKSLCRWQETQERIGMQTPWNTVLEAIQEARGGSPNLRLTHINQAKNTFVEESTTRKRKATQEGDGPSSGVKRSRRDQSIANAGGVSRRNHPQRENENGRQKHGASIQRKRIGTRRIGDEMQENEEVVRSQKGNITDTHPLRRSIGLGGLEHSPIRSATQESLDDSPEQGLVSDKRIERRVSVARSEGSDDEVQSNQNLYNPPIPHYGGVLDGIATSTEYVNEEMSKDLRNSPAPGRRPSTVVIEDMEASKVNDIEQHIRSILEDLYSPFSLSERSLHFFLEKMVPKRSIRVLDSSSVSDNYNISSRHRSQIKDVRGIDTLLAPICVRGRWVLMIFNILRGFITILDSVKSESEYDSLKEISQHLGEMIQSAEGAEVSCWTSVHETSTTEDFGIQVLVNCLHVASDTRNKEDELSFKPVDTVLWRALLSTTIDDDAWIDVMNSWTAESEPSNSSSLRDEQLRRYFPESSEIKDRLAAAFRLKARITYALETHLPHMKNVFARLVCPTNEWGNDVSDEIEVIEADASKYEQKMGELRDMHQFHTRTDATELERYRALLEGCYQHCQQNKSERLQRQLEAIERMQKLHKSISESIKKSQHYLERLHEIKTGEIEDCRENLDRVEQAEMNKNEKEIAELKEKVGQMEASLEAVEDSRTQRQSDQRLTFGETESTSTASSRFP